MSAALDYYAPEMPTRFFDLFGIGRETHCRYLWSPRVKDKPWQAMGRRQSGRPVTRLLDFKLSAEAWLAGRGEKACSVDCYISPNQFFDWRNTKQLAQLHANWVEIDTREHVTCDLADEQTIVQEALTQLAQLGLPAPTAYVLSGSGGVHLYWIYHGVDAYKWRVSFWKSIADRLCEGLSGGPLWVVDHGASKDPARVLRLADTFHGKTGRMARAKMGGPLYRFESLARALGLPCQDPVALGGDTARTRPSPVGGVTQTADETIPVSALRTQKPRPIPSAQSASPTAKPGPHSIKQWWFRIYTHVVSELRQRALPVPEGRRDNTAFILFVALRHISDAEDALTRIKDLNTELIQLPEKDLLQYLGTSMKTLYRYRKETLAGFLEKQLDIRSDFLFINHATPLPPDEIRRRQQAGGRQTALHRQQETLARLQTALNTLRQTRMTVTQGGIAEAAKVSLRTVKRYWGKLKTLGDKRSLSIYSPPCGSLLL